MKTYKEKIKEPLDILFNILSNDLKGIKRLPSIRDKIKEEIYSATNPLDLTSILYNITHIQEVLFAFLIHKYRRSSSDYSIRQKQNLDRAIRAEKMLSAYLSGEIKELKQIEYILPSSCPEIPDNSNYSYAARMTSSNSWYIKENSQNCPQIYICSSTKYKSPPINKNLMVELIDPIEYWIISNYNCSCIRTCITFGKLIDQNTFYCYQTNSELPFSQILSWL